MTGRRKDEGPAGPWGPLTLEEGGETAVEVGPLTIHLARTAGEVRLAHTRRPLEPAGERDQDPAGGTGDGTPDPELDWSRWAPGPSTGPISLVPAFPERPLVVAPDEPFHLLAGAEARVYVRVPLWVKVTIEGRRGTTTLVPLPTIPASDTWWGSVEEGELAYWLTTHARRVLTDDLFEPYLAMCPLQLVNRSDDDLDVEKIALRTAYLTLYRDGQKIWADETRVSYQGDAEGSRLEMAGKAPREAEGAALLAPPALRMGRGFRARTFGRLRSIQGWMT